MLEFIKKIPGLRSGIGRRFILYILLFSSVITFVGTGLQLYLDYDRDVELIHSSLRQVQSSYLHSITNSLWVTDDELLHIQLEGIMRLPDMQFIEVRKGTEVLQAIGTPQSESIIEQTIPLVYDYNGQDVHLGELHVVASLKGVYARILDRVLVILGIQTIKTFLVSLFIFIIFYLLVGKHIFYMASFVESIRFESMEQPLHLDRKPNTKKPDELDRLSTAFNRMRENLARDITEKKLAEEQINAALKEKEILLREIHHRVKNNMQVITSLLSLQSDTIKDQQYADMFRESQERIRSMALIHETLYQSEDFANIDFDGYLWALINNLFISYGINPEIISMKIKTNDLSLALDYAIPCGLIINELVSNCLKHAFPDEREGEIQIVLQEISENEIELTVSDNGMGIPEEFDFGTTESLGLDLVKVLAEHQLGGRIEMNGTGGTRFSIRFMVKPEKARI